MEKKEKKEASSINEKSVILMIISVLIGLFTIYFGIYLFQYNSLTSYIFGILFCLVGVFACLPRILVKISYGKKILIVILACIALSVLLVLTNRPSNNLINHNMGENFTLIWTTSNDSLIIYNATESTSYNGETTKGYFVLINCGLTNLGNNSNTFGWLTEYSLVDNQNETFKGTFSGLQDTFQPDVEKGCYFLFEIPKTAQGLKLNFRDSASTHIVDLKI